MVLWLGGGMKYEGPRRYKLFVPLQPSHATSPRHAHSTRNMEDDRAATNLGPDVDEGILEEPTAAPKQPRRRFVGRKNAETANEQQADPNANIEDSSAIQGVRRLQPP
jgi:hypothetical protein